MSGKKILALGPIVALICIAAFSGMASATSSYASTLISSGGINGGGIIAASSVLGSSPDTAHAVIASSYAYAGAYVIVQPSTTPIASGSYISIYASRYSTLPTTALHVFVSSNSNGPWSEVSNSPMQISGTSDSWHSFQSNQQFSYIKVEVWSSTTNCAGYIDSILTM